MFPTKTNHSCLECWSKTISLSLAFPDTELCSAAALHVLFEIMCQMAVKQSPFLTGFPPLGSHRKSCTACTLLFLEFASLCVKVPLSHDACSAWKNLNSWFRERKSWRERGENTMSSGGGAESSVYMCVDAYHMCSACFSLHHVAHAKKGDVVIFLICWQRGKMQSFITWRITEQYIDDEDNYKIRTEQLSSRSSANCNTCSWKKIKS